MLVRAPFHRPGWVYEEKVDRHGMLAYRAGKQVPLVSRNMSITASAFQNSSLQSRACRAVPLCYTVRWPL